MTWLEGLPMCDLHLFPGCPSILLKQVYRLSVFTWLSGEVVYITRGNIYLLRMLIFATGWFYGIQIWSLLTPRNHVDSLKTPHQLLSVYQG